MRFQQKALCVQLALVFGAGSVWAQDATGPVQRVEITGSSIKRIDGETALPVTVIKREDIDKTGATNVQELVDRMAVNNGGGISLGQSVGDSSATGQVGASMRGLGRERTLVLLNGRRLTPYPFQGTGIDLNAIPLAAIERIEVLRDGASAVYGSDALGGVMNFITRKDFTGGEISASAEITQLTGGRTSQVAGGFGFGDLSTDRFNIFGTLSYQKYGVIKAADRDYAQTGNRPDLGVVKSSGNAFPANAWTLNDTYVPGASQFPNCNPPDSFPGASNCRYDYTHYIDLYPESDRLGVMGRGVFALSNDHSLFAELTYSRNKMTFGSSQTPSTTTGKPSYLYPSGGKWYPTDAVNAAEPGYTGDLVIAWRMVDGGQRRDQVTNEMTRILVGGEGTFGTWDYKYGLMRAQSKARDNYISGYYSDERLVQQLATGLINPFGPNDADGLAALKAAELTGDIRNSETAVTGLDLQGSTQLMAMAGGSLALAVGGEMRRETYHDGYSDLAASGDIVGGSGTAGAVDGSRTIVGIYGELSVPFAKDFELQLAARADRYSDAKGSSRDGSFTNPDASAFSPKVGMRWQPMKEFLLRGSIGKGFRAPGLDALFAPSAYTNSGGNWTDPFYDTIRGCAIVANTNYCDTQLTVRNDANPALKPEKSTQFSLGFVLEPTAGLTLGADYFHIKITDGLTFLTGDQIMQDWNDNKTGPTTSSSVYADRLVTDPATGYLSYVRASWENVGNQEVAGFDLSASYRIQTEAGTFTPSVEATLMTKNTRSLVGTDITQDFLGKYYLGGPIVRLKQVWALDWQSGDWAAGLIYSHQGGYRDYGNKSDVDAYGLLGLNLAYKGIKGFTIAGGVRNALNTKPPTSVQEDYFQVGFDPTYADVRGRSYYVRGTYRF